MLQQLLSKIVGECIFTPFPSRNILRAWIRLSCTENHLVFLYEFKFSVQDCLIQHGKSFRVLIHTVVICKYSSLITFSNRNYLVFKLANNITESNLRYFWYFLSFSNHTRMLAISEGNHFEVKFLFSCRGLQTYKIVVHC